jgi:phosphatidylglycerol:prolipoprotein diacylglycerol transferase
MGFCGHMVHRLDPIMIHFPVSWPIRGIYWYGVAYIVAFAVIAGILRIYGRCGRLPFPRDAIGPFICAIVGGVIIGGRVGYMLLYDFHTLISNPLETFCLWHGGMASHGGFIGVGIAVIIFSRKYNVKVLSVADVISAAAPIGLFFGRIANFVNGELYGKISTVPWAVIFPNSAPAYLPSEFIRPRHPSQIYEALLEGLLLFIICQLRFFRNPQLHRGRLCGEFLCFYALLRVAVEFFREPDAAPIISLSRGQFYSILLFKIGLYVIVFSQRLKHHDCGRNVG